MAASLEIWQQRLEKHFAELAAHRERSGYHLFALEHNLTRADLKEIGDLLRSRLANGLCLGPHWLLWVVYATEIGYDYEGDEYWHSYEVRTPYWQENASRSQLRDWFYKFHINYYGVEPSGPWADWFSIIAWPVTHAILPKYLQLQLARSLYRLRYSLASAEVLSPGELGKLVAAESWDASSRFRAFLEQEELAGRIVLALLTGKTPNDQGPIYHSALQRIVSDLEQVQSAREWLNEVQRVVANRFKGAARAPIAKAIHAEAAHDSGKYGTPMLAGTSPALLLRSSSSEAWSVVIEIPSLGAISRLSPDFRVFIAGTRCRIAGTGGTWMPAGWLLFNGQRRVLKTWPDPSQPVLEFERQNRTLDHVLASECRLSPGPIWVFRIGSDKLAREIKGRLVRPGNRYILISHDHLAVVCGFRTPLHMDCTGIEANLLSLPDRLSSQDIDCIERLGLRVALTIRVWPAGLSARAWDGEGHTEWLTTETPCFGLGHDYPVEAYAIRLNNGPEQIIEAGGVDHPTFVRLQPLPAGRHVLSVRTHRSTSSQSAEGFVTLDVREPEPWIPGTTSHVGLAVALDPYNPSLDTFLEGNAGVTIFGPEGRRVTCAISLASSGGAELLSQEIGSFELPVLPATLSRKLSSITKEGKHPWAYLEASTGCLVIKGDELGEYVVRLERNVKPVRWVCLGGPRTATLRLIDETGLKEAALVQFFSFARPAMSVQLPTIALKGWEAEAPGGLFTAHNAQHRDALIVSAPQVTDGFKGLLANADLRDLQESCVSAESILNMLDLWSTTRLAGPLARIRRDHVTASIINLLFARLCGSRWAETEKLYLSGRNSGYSLHKLEAAVGGSAGFAATLRHDYRKMEAGTALGVRWFADVASRYSISLEPDLCEFALRLASQPHRLPAVFGSDLYGWLHRISDRTNLLRGARLLALLAAVDSRERDTMIPGWQWS